MAGGVGAAPEIRPAFLQTWSQRLQKKLQWAAPTARVLPVCRPSLPGRHMCSTIFSSAARTFDYSNTLRVQWKRVNPGLTLSACVLAARQCQALPGSAVRAGGPVQSHPASPADSVQRQNTSTSAEPGHTTGRHLQPGQICTFVIRRSRLFFIVAITANYLF